MASLQPVLVRILMLARLLAIRPGEGRLASRLGAHNFLICAANTLFLAVAESLFLVRFSTNLLPYTYVASAIASLILGMLYERAQLRVPPRTLTTFVTASVSVALGMAYVGLFFAPHLGAFVFLCLAPPCDVLLSLESASLATRVLNSRSARRLFPTIGAVGAAGATIGALLISILAKHIPPMHLTLVGILLALVASPLAASPGEFRPSKAQRRAAPWDAVFKHRFATALLLLALLLGVLSTCARFQLSVSVKATLAPEQIASFFGLLYSSLNAGSVLFQLLISRAALSSLGVAASLMIYPLFMAVLGGAFIAWPVLPLAASIVVVESLVRQNLQRPALIIAAMPIPDTIRTRTFSAIRGWLKSVAICAASAALLPLARFLHAYTVSIIILTGALIAAMCAFIARSGYVRELGAALRARRLRISDEADQPDVLDPRARAMLENQLKSDIPDHVLLALHILNDAITPATLQILESRWPTWPAWLRAEAVKRLAKNVDDGAVSFLRSLDAGEPPLVQAELSRAAIPHLSDSELDRLATLDLVQSDALAEFLKRYGWSRVRDRVLASTPAVVAQILAGTDAPCSAQDRPHLVSLATQALDDDATFEAARKALLHLRPADIPSRSARALAVLATLDIRRVLPFLTDPDPELRTRTLQALLTRPILEPEMFSDAVEVEIASANRLRTLQAQTSGIVREEADADVQRAFDRLFMALQLTVPSRPIRKAYLSIFSGETRERAFAVEWLDESLDSRWRRRVIDLIEVPTILSSRESDPWIERITRAINTPGSDATIDRAIELKRHSPFRYWRLRDLEPLGSAPLDTAHVLGTLESPAVQEAIAHRVGCGAAWLRDLAERAGAKQSTGQLSRMDVSLASSENARDDQALSDEADLWQRMFFLRMVPLFEGLTPERLRLLSQITHAHTVERGKTIVRQGLPGHNFYLVCTGRVLVERDGQILATLGEAEAFGELALLTGGARSATVRALEACELLAIDRFDFLDLIETHPAMVQAMTRTILARIAPQSIVSSP